jgi:5-(carboxyamino)imidazole ribonucleotide mutase
MSKIKSNKVSIVMGSQTDFKTMELCQIFLKKMNIKYETKIISAHRTPDRMFQYAKNVEKNTTVFGNPAKILNKSNVSK